jgi:osmotically-inducible protein OsmY
MKTAAFLLMCGIAIAGCEQSDATKTQTSSSTPDNVPTQTNTNTTVSTSTDKPDNTAVNVRDREPGSVTAGSQGQSQSDINVTANIRQRILKNNLSITAQNVKIICQNGHVTLRGPVNNQDEKDSIGRIANEIAGADNVDNQLEVKPNI